MEGFTRATGMRTFEVRDVDGSVAGTVKFNPTDLGLASRWNDAGKAIRELTNTPLDTPEAIGEADKEIKAQIDYAFGSPASAVLFAGVSSLAVCEDGRLVVENVLDAITPIIREAQAKAAKTTEARLKKHTAKYQNTKAGLAPEQK